MSESSEARPVGSRAIKIPLQSRNTEYNNPPRRRRAGRYRKALEQAENSDAGPSSVGSDQGSAWSVSPAARAPQLRLESIASPSTKDPRLPGTATPAEGDATPTQRKDKDKANLPPPSTLPPLSYASTSPLGPSMLSSSSYKSINLNSHHDDPDEPPRLITYTKHSQGFTWNDELFLPSYLLGRYGGRGRQKQYDSDFGDEDHCPVAEIFVTDEEAEAMMP